MISKLLGMSMFFPGERGGAKAKKIDFGGEKE
jgi:hypothetical protein